MKNSNELTIWLRLNTMTQTHIKVENKIQYNCPQTAIRVNSMLRKCENKLSLK